MKMIPHDALLPAMPLFFLSAVWAFPFRPPDDLDVMPRTTVLFNALQGCQRFSGSALNYSVLLLQEEDGRLYVGARGAIYALQASNITAHSSLTISWEASAEHKQQCLNKGRDNKTECFNHVRLLERFNSTHLYTCGTHAFSPLCAYVDTRKFGFSSAFEEGRDRCPYDPAKGYSALIIDEEIYSASQYEFRSFPDIRRNSPSPALRTEEAPTRWLVEADFVGSALVKAGVSRSLGDDDDKILFFFTERSGEQGLQRGISREARVARICKGDRGGLLTLQRKWTSFLKARLVCSLPEFDLQFNLLRSVFLLHGPDAQHTLLYAIFGLEWRSVKASVVCVYSLADVERAFEGPYMESEDSGSRWTAYTGKVPLPRPGGCITEQLRARGINSSTQLPDDVLHFVRRHPLMHQQILPQAQSPLLFRRNVDYTQIAVHRVTALDGLTYPVLFFGTDDGWLQRAVEVKGRIHIIEELQLFEEPQSVDRIIISETQRSVYVGSPSAVVQLPLATCHRSTSCFDCVFARDPLCGWDGQMCTEITADSDRTGLVQDVLRGRQGCENPTAKGSHALVVQRLRSVLEGDDVLLRCELSSNLATPLWTQDGVELQGYDLVSGSRIGTDGLLVLQARPEQSGEYRCHAVENGLRVPVLTYALTVRPNRPTPNLRPPLPPEPTRPPPQPSNRPPILQTSLQPSRESPARVEHPTAAPTEAPPSPQHSELLSARNLEALYLTLVTVLGGLCVVLSVVLLYVGFCLQGRGGGKYSLRQASAQRGAHIELKTVSARCNGNGEAHAHSDARDALLQIVPGEAKHLPPAPPLPPPLPNGNGLSATLPSVLRKMNGNSYMLLRQSETDSNSPFCYTFTEELSRILEKRKHSQLYLTTKPDESSV